MPTVTVTVTATRAEQEAAALRAYRSQIDITNAAIRPESSRSFELASESLTWRSGPWSARVVAQYTGAQTSTGGAALTGYAHVNASVGHELTLAPGRRRRLRAGLDNLGNVRLAEQLPEFGYAERARRAFVQARLQF
ncbi:MAG: hypothetical protein ABS84_07930 [Rubrivivax sp. SCN 71-131]|jgi:outer membrane receptor for ferrienterochelin and colicins|nr:MAG: hypothetical protein ABS84_07930 [Rubrivivax sp. SCN 71-131]